MSLLIVESPAKGRKIQKFLQGTDITVTFDASGLAGGEYNANIVINSNGYINIISIITFLYKDFFSINKNK